MKYNPKTIVKHFRRAIIFALLTLTICVPRAFAQTELYVFNLDDNGGSGATPIPSGSGSTLYMTASVQNANGCSCPATWTPLFGTNGLTATGISFNACKRAASGATTPTVLCNGSNSGVTSTMYLLANVAGVDNTASSTSNSAATLTITAPTLSFDHDLVMIGGNSGSCNWWAPSQLSGWDLGSQPGSTTYTEAYGINWDHTHPRAPTYRTTCGAIATILAATYFEATTPVSAPANHFLPYRDFQRVLDAATVNGVSYTPDTWIQPGDLEWCAMQRRDTAFPTSADPAWTSSPIGTSGCTAGAGSQSMCVYVKKAGASEYLNTYNWAWAANAVTSVECGAVYGVDTSGSAPYVDASNSDSGSNTWPARGSSVTPSQAGDLIMDFYGSPFGEGASGGGWWQGGFGFTDGTEDDPNVGSQSPSELMVNAFIDPTADPTGLHNAANKKTPSNGYMSHTLAFKMVAAPAPMTISGGITGRFNPLSTNTQTASAPCSSTAHFIPYGSIANDLYVTTREDDDFNSTPIWLAASSPTVPTIAASSNNSANTVNSSVSELTVTNGTPPSFWSENQPAGNCVVAYGIDYSFHNATFGQSCANSTGATPPSLTGCGLTGLNGPTFDNWVGSNDSGLGGTGIVGDPGDTFLLKSNTRIAPTGLNDWVGYQSKSGSFTPSGTTPGSGDAVAVSEFSILSTIAPTNDFMFGSFSY
jgi:hypothetical protein